MYPGLASSEAAFDVTLVGSAVLGWRLDGPWLQLAPKGPSCIKTLTASFSHCGCCFPWRSVASAPFNIASENQTILKSIQDSFLFSHLAFHVCELLGHFLSNRLNLLLHSFPNELT